MLLLLSLAVFNDRVQLAAQLPAPDEAEAHAASDPLAQADRQTSRAGGSRNEQGAPDGAAPFERGGSGAAGAAAGGLRGEAGEKRVWESDSEDEDGGEEAEVAASASRGMRKRMRAAP